MVDKTSSSWQNFCRALLALERSIALPIREARDLSGVIKDFELVYELSWKVLKKLLLEEGHTTLGAKDVYTKAYKLSYLDAEAIWLQMIQDRNTSTHIYSEATAQKLVEHIKTQYLEAFKNLHKKLDS